MTPYTNPPKPRSAAWIKRVGDMLRDGFGSEDIAVLLDCHQQQVRDQIGTFRKDGSLAKWFPHA